ncbi:MAG: hypothetical protein ACFFD2_10860 [Promethearchaeota archaeon]
MIISFVLSLAVYLVIIILGIISKPGFDLIPNEYISEFIQILPGSIYTDLILIYIIPILFFFLFYFIAPFFVTFYIRVHKFFYRILRRPSKYGIFKSGLTVKAGRLFYRSFIVSLFSFAISALIVQMGYGGLFRPGFESVPEKILGEAEAIFLGTFILCAFIIILFFPIWLLEDSGVVSYRVFHGERMPVDIQGAHSVYYNILLGYAGLSTIITLVYYIGATLGVVGLTDPALFTPIILIVLPIILTGLFSIPIYLYERFYDRMYTRLQLKLAKFNFPKIDIPKFEEMKREK